MVHIEICPRNTLFPDLPFICRGYAMSNIYFYIRWKIQYSHHTLQSTAARLLLNFQTICVNKVLLLITFLSISNFKAGA